MTVRKRSTPNTDLNDDDRPSSARLRGRRQMLIDVAHAHLREDGLAAFNMREIARRAGVSHQTPHNYFAHRNELLSEIASEALHILRTHLETASLATSDGERLRLVGERYVMFALEYPSYFNLIFARDVAASAQTETGRSFQPADIARYFSRSVRQSDAGDLAGEEQLSALARWSTVHGIASISAGRLWFSETGSGEGDPLTLVRSLLAADRPTDAMKATVRTTRIK